MTDEELTAAIRDVQEKVRRRHSQGSSGPDGLTSADLMPLVHARDAAEAKVAAIGTVNPRPPGLGNAVIQRLKRLVSRALDWHVREQVEFNRATMVCVQATLEALTDISRSMAALAAYRQELRQHSEDLTRALEEWRSGIEQQRAASEIHLLRTVSELQSSFQLRASVIEQNFRDSLRQQHDDFSGELDRRTIDIQKVLWQDMEKIRGEYDRLIHTELRLPRQRAAAGPGAAAVSPAPPPEVPALDWTAFVERFRGPEDRIRELQKCHAARFCGSPGEVLDLGCGRGEFLEAARAAGVTARGVDQSSDSIALCRSKGLDVEQSDVFEYLQSLPDASLGGAFCAQVVEHLAPSAVPHLVRLLSQKLRLGALLAIETPNPECLAIFATHFYLDPTHTRPVPAPLLRFYLESEGFGSIQVERLSPAIDSMPALSELPAPFRDAFFGGLDYAIFARKL